MSERVLSPESIEAMAGKIAFVSFDVIQFRDNEMRSHWYHYKEIDLYYFQALSGVIAKIHISIFGQVVEWNPMDGLRTGMLIEQEGEAGVSELIRYDARANQESLKQSMKVLEQAHKIELVQRQQLLSCLRQGPRTERLSFLRKILKVLFKSR